MPETIRRIEERDFEKVASLYAHRKTVEELKWLFTDPYNTDNFNAFVAVNECDVVLGVIGYTLSVYTDGTNFISGVIPMSWKIADEYKGLAGIQLFNKVLALGDFKIAIAGSDTAQQLYPLFKYRFFSTCFEYYKLLDVSNTTKSLLKKTWLKKLGFVCYLLPTYFNNPRKNPYSNEIKFIPYTKNNFIEEKNISNIFGKKITANYIDWLLKCPVIKSHAFCVYHKKQYLGICVLYTQLVNNNYRGRIVHLPFLGFDKDLWVAVVDSCIQFFKNEKCCLISGLAHHPVNRTGYIESGFSSVKGYEKPIFIKDSNDRLATFDLKNWFLQYSEGDNAYRDL